jgi:hypothetical protein
MVKNLLAHKADHFVSSGELGHSRAYTFDYARSIPARDHWKPCVHDRASKTRLQCKVCWVECGRLHPDKHAVLCQLWVGDIRKFKYLRPTIPPVNNRSHG